MGFNSPLSQHAQDTPQDDATSGNLYAASWIANKSEVAQYRMVREVMEDARLHSEVRYLGTLVANFCAQLDRFIAKEDENSPSHLNQKQLSSLLELYTRFNCELSLLCSSITTERNSSYVYSLESMLRTPLEEAILSLQSNELSSYRDPSVVRGWLIDGYRTARECAMGSSNSLLRTLVPNSPLPAVWIQEFRGGVPELSDTQCLELLSLINTRVVDTTLAERKEGFGREYSPEEFTKVVRRNTTHLCIPYTSDEPLGIYTIDATIDNQPLEVQAALREKFSKDTPLSDAGWVDITALAGNARDRLRGPCDTWLLAKEKFSTHNPSRILLQPTDSTDVGPGDFVVDTSKELHTISYNSAHQMSAPPDWKIVTTHNEIFTKNQILLYLKMHSLCPLLPGHQEPSQSSAYQIEFGLHPTSVTEIVKGDFALDRSGHIHEIESNSATGAIAPKSWALRTKNGDMLGVFDVHSYLKRTPISQEELNSLQAPSLYRWLTAAASESAVSLGITSLFCQVRVGRNGNTAREKHLAVGWEPTELMFSIGGFEYEILYLDPYRILTGIPFREVTHILSDKPHLKGDQNYFRSLAKSAWSLPPDLIGQETFIDRIQQEYPTCKVGSTIDSLHRLQITVTPNTGSPIYFIQGLANTDLWRKQEDLLYTRSLYNPLVSLDKTLQRIDRANYSS